jgi:hypothetical protein
MCRRHRSIHAGPSPGDGENGSGDWRWAERDEMVLEDGKKTRREREKKYLKARRALIVDWKSEAPDLGRNILVCVNGLLCLEPKIFGQNANFRQEN